MKKKLLMLVLTVLLALACALTFVACGSGGRESGGGRDSSHDGTYFLYSDGALDHDTSLTITKGKITGSTGDEYSQMDGKGVSVSHSGSVSGNSIEWIVTMTTKKDDVNMKMEVTSVGEINNGVIHFTEEKSKNFLGMLVVNEKTSDINVYYCMDGKTPENIGTGGSGEGGDGRPGQSNTMQTAIPATLGTVYTVNTSDGDGMWYSFTPTESSTYVIQSKDAINCDPYVALYDESGSQLGQDDDGANDGNSNFKLVYYLEADVTYYLNIISYNYRGGINCKFSIGGLPHSTRDDAIVLQSIDGFAAEFVVSYQQIWYAYTPTTSGTYLFHADYTPNSLYIYRGQEQTALASHRISDNNISGLNLACELESGTTYYFCCECSNDYYHDTWEISVELCDGSERSKALVASLNTQYNINIATAGGEVWYVFRPTVYGRYVIQSSNSTDDPFCALFREDDGYVIVSDDNSAGGNDFRIVRVLEENVNYYIRASMASQAGTGSYKLTVAPADGSTAETAVLVRADVDYTVAPSADHPVWLEFDPPVSGEYTIRSTGNVGDPACEVYTAGNDTPVYTGDTGGSGNNFLVSCNLFTNYSTYYIVVSQLSSTAQGDFTVRISSPEGSTRTNPVNVILGNEYPKNDCNTNTGMWYAFTPTQSGAYVMRTVDFYTGNPYGTLYDDENESQIDYDDNSGYNNNFHIRSDLTAGVTYYIHVTGAPRFTFVWEVADGSERSMAKTAALNTPYQVNITDPDQEVWYAFKPALSGDYLFVSDAVGSCDPVCTFYSGNSSSVEDYDDNSGSGNNFSLIRSLSSTSIYYVCLKVNNDHTGVFTFTIKRLDGTSRETAYILRDNGNTDVQFASTTTQSVWYTFTPYVSGQYTFESRYADYLDPNVTLYQGNSTTSLATNDNISNDDPNFRLQYNLVAGTTYYLEIGKGSTSNKGNFDVYVIGIPGSTRDHAITATLGTQYDADFVYAGQNIWFEYTPTQTGNYVIASSDNSTNTDPFVLVYNGNASPSENDISSSDLNFSLTRTLNADQTYYFCAKLSVELNYDQVGSYKFSITVAPGASRETAIAASVGSSYTVVAGATSTVVWYSFTPTTTQEYSIFSTDISGNCDPYLTVYQGNSTSSLTTNNDGGDNKNFSINLELTANTTYYFMASLARDSGVGTYTINFEGEQGTSRRNPNIVEFGETYQLDIVSGQKVWYKFVPRSTAKYNIVTSAPSTGMSAVCEVYSGTNSTGATYISTNGLGTFDYAVSMVAGTAYYFELGNSDLTLSGSYCFSVTSSSGATREGAIEVNAGGSYTITLSGGNSSTNSDSKWLVFTPTVMGNYKMKSSSSTVNDPDMQIYVGDNSNNNSSLSHTSTGPIDITVTLTAGTTYYIELYGYHGNGSFTFTITSN